MKKRKAKSEDESIQDEKTKHQDEADLVCTKKREDKQRAKEDNTIKCYAFDLQQCLPTPYLNTSVAFYKRQLWTFNLTFHETTTGDVTCFMWHEAEGARGANQIATCIFKQLSSLTQQIKKAILYSDSCGGQNRNSHVSAMFLTLLQQCSQLEQIDHKFMVSGHSHLECDVDHGMIEKQKKHLQMQISVPHDWYQLVRDTGKKKKFQVVELNHKDFVNYSDLYKSHLKLKQEDSNGNSFKWTELRWLRYRQEFPKNIFFKSSLDEREEFRCMNLEGRISQDTPLNSLPCYTSSLVISNEKKILDLLSPDFHDFDKNLKTTNNAKSTLHDLVKEKDEELE
ncbi:unnamed protein product [Psylliodes chrysocephalus]|uniref:DUF7869 domain-containing protein n=1 Tax=Psylliodes chrysocephalus TaxID=3402493 RepID=A0A9P0D354_9CUCU|nr:unnamed protein product [Psylliodes chrysocephala]